MPSISHHIRDDVTGNGAGFRRFEVVTGERRRRGWSVDEKLAIVAESFSAATSISEVARRHQLNRNQLFQWRAQFRRGELGEATIGPFVPLTVQEVAAPLASPPTEPLARSAAPMIEVTIGAVTVRVPSGMDETTVHLVLAALARVR